MSALELTDAEVRFLREALEDSGSELAVAIREKVMALGIAPTPVRCYHCHTVQETEVAYVEHLVKAHHYPDDEFSEDTAQTNAWDAFNRGR